MRILLIIFLFIPCLCFASVSNPTNPDTTVKISDGTDALVIDSNGNVGSVQYNSSGTELATNTNPTPTANYRYNVENEEWVYETETNKGIHLCVDDISATTGVVLVDLSDTTNFPHNNTARLCITGYQITISPDNTYVGKVLIGFLENVDATNGDFKPLLCWDMDKATTALINQSLVLDSPLCASSTDFLTPGNVDDTTWQTDTALMSPYDATAAYTTVPGNGDLVMKIVRTGGSVSVGISIKYYSMAS